MNWLLKNKLLRREYLALAVNVLTNSPKISDMTETDIFQRNFSKIDEKNDESDVVLFYGLFNMLTVKGVV